MCHLFESIRIEDGKIQQLNSHQDRINRSLKKLKATNQINLEEFTSQLELPKQGLHKLRISYDTAATITHSITPYIYKDNIRSVQLVVCNDIEYDLKYEDRSTINQLVKHAKTDEIIIVKNGFITDSSIANIAFLKNKQWFTPKTPLLEGTQRRLLLDNNRVQSSDIRPSDLNQFSLFCFFNALNPFEKAKHYSINLILDN